MSHGRDLAEAATLTQRERKMADAKDVVVTGVSTGIGWGTPKVLVAKGFRVFGSVRKQTDADRLQKEFGDRSPWPTAGSTAPTSS
jgi:NAD(P)-dependent dehydrogenase (short-subunit alcohol dehydrogenase family)